MERLFTFLFSSTHRWDVLIKVTGHGVRRVIETRWSARGQAVGVVKKYFHEIIDILKQLMGIEENIATRSEAGLIVSSIQSFPFLCFLSFWGTVLKERTTHKSICTLQTWIFTKMKWRRLPLKHSWLITEKNCLWRPRYWDKFMLPLPCPLSWAHAEKYLEHAGMHSQCLVE